MKKYIFFLSSIVLSVLFSCNSGFLDEQPPTRIASDLFWKSENDVQLALTGCYSRLQSRYLSFGRTYFDAIVDNGYARNFNDCKNMQTGALTKGAPGFTSDFYSACYQGIAACNDFLKKYKQVGLPEAKAKKYEAQARFLRAYLYSELVQRFGGVVIYKEVPATLDGYLLPRSSETDVYALIGEDLEYAISNLDQTAYTDGHAVQSSALALKARVAFFKGEWDNVAAITKELISPSSGTPLYSLAADLESQFIKNRGQDKCPEIIFSVKYLQAKDGRQSSDGGQEVEFFRWSGMLPMQDLIDEYETGDQRVAEWYFQPVNGTGYMRPNGTIFSTGGDYLTGWGLVKFFDKNDDGRYIAAERDIPTGHDIVLFRLADVMLMYAEAMVEKGGGTTSDALAVQVINDIQTRAGVGKNLTSITQDIVRKERRRELAFEGFRQNDIVRWRIGSQINGKTVYTSGSVTVKIKWDDSFYMWPFALSEENKNPNLKGHNNPGY